MGGHAPPPQGDANCGSSFSTSCHVWRDVESHGCRHGQPLCRTRATNRKARHGSLGTRRVLRIIILPFPRRGHNGRYHRGVWPPWPANRPTSSRAGCSSACSASCTSSPLSRLRCKSRASWEIRASCRRADSLERAHAAYGSTAYRYSPRSVGWCASDGMLHALAWAGRGARRAAGGGGWPRPRSAASLDLLPVARRGGPDLLWFQWTRAARDRTPGGAVRAHAAVAESPARGPALDGDAVAGVGARCSGWMSSRGSRSSASGDPTWRHLTALDFHLGPSRCPPGRRGYAAMAPQGCTAS